MQPRLLRVPNYCTATFTETQRAVAQAPFLFAAIVDCCQRPDLLKGIPGVYKSVHLLENEFAHSEYCPSKYPIEDSRLVCAKNLHDYSG